MPSLYLSKPADLLSIALCHKECFQKSFSTRLGLDYSVKTFEWFLVDPNRFLYHVCDGNMVIGYCGGLAPQFMGDGSASGMLQYAMKEAGIGILKKPQLLLNRELIHFYPLIFKNLYHKFSGFRFKKKIHLSNARQNEKKVGLVVIGVHPSWRGKGVFQMLMKKFEQEALERNAVKITLSVKAKNRRAISAYQKAGWKTALLNERELKMYKLIHANEK